MHLFASTVGRLSVSRKLYLSFGVLIALLVAVIAVAMSGMSSLATAFNHVSKSATPKVEAANATRSAGADMHFSQTRYVLAPEQYKDFLGDKAIFEADLAKVGKLSGPEEKTQYDAIVQTYDHWKAVDAQLWALARTHQLAKATALVTGEANDVSDQLVAALTAYQDRVDAELKHDNTTFTSTRSSSTVAIVALGVVAVLVAVGLATLLGRALVGGIKQMLAAAEGISVGDLDQKVESKSSDEIGQTVDAFSRMIAYLRETAGAAEQIASGDLTVDVQPKSERDTLGNAFAAMIQNLRQMISDVGMAASTVGASSKQIASSSEEAGRAVGDIANAVTSVAEGAERQVRMVEDAQESTELTGRAAGDASAAARAGIVAADEASEAMHRLQDQTRQITDEIRALASKSEQIGSIVETITSIAGQTNLLALNAAIEAARAGEQGRGFAVVADEVRKLAEESQKAATTIGMLIEEIQADTERTVRTVEAGAEQAETSAATVESTRAAFRDIGSLVDDIASRVEQLVESTAEVAAVAQGSSAATQEVSATTEETSASTQQIAATAQELASSAEALNNLVSRFSIV